MEGNTTRRSVAFEDQLTERIFTRAGDTSWGLEEPSTSDFASRMFAILGADAVMPPPQFKINQAKIMKSMKKITKAPIEPVPKGSVGSSSAGNGGESKLERLRRREKALQNEIKRVKAETKRYEENELKGLRAVDDDVTKMKKETQQYRKQIREIKSECKQINEMADEMADETVCLSLHEKMNEAFFNKFLKIDKDGKCTNKDLCTSFHKDGHCFPLASPAAGSSTRASCGPCTPSNK